MSYFSKISTDSGKWKVEKGQQEKNVLFSVLREEINAVF